MAEQSLQSQRSLYSGRTEALPPWREASMSEKWRICVYSVVIYLPVALLIAVELALLPLYLGLYFWPMAVEGDDRPELYYWHSRGERTRARAVGCVCLAVLSLLVGLFSLSFYQVSCSPAGSVPSTAEWRDYRLAERTLSPQFHEKKHSDGSMRWCRHCSSVKPDRAHHCRLCGTCVLQMDHHCPWIANCVGYFNYKYFFLMLLYGMLSLWLFVGTFWQTAVVTWRDEESGVWFSFLVTVVLALVLILAASLTAFWGFHLYLILTATTTIEYSERRSEQRSHPYSRSLYQNLQSALGRQPAFWLLPIRYRSPEEDGLSFPSQKSS